MIPKKVRGTAFKALYLTGTVPRTYKLLFFKQTTLMGTENF